MPLLELMWKLADSLADAPKSFCEGFPLANYLQVEGYPTNERRASRSWRLCFRVGLEGSDRPDGVRVVRGAVLAVGVAGRDVNALEIHRPTAC